MQVTEKMRRQIMYMVLLASWTMPNHPDVKLNSANQYNQPLAKSYPLPIYSPSQISHLCVFQLVCVFYKIVAIRVVVFENCFFHSAFALGPALSFLFLLWESRWYFSLRILESVIKTHVKQIILSQNNHRSYSAWNHCLPALSPLSSLLHPLSDYFERRVSTG